MSKLFMFGLTLYVCSVVTLTVNLIISNKYTKHLSSELYYIIQGVQTGYFMGIDDKNNLLMNLDPNSKNVLRFKLYSNNMISPSFQANNFKTFQINLKHSIIFDKTYGRQLSLLQTISFGAEKESYYLTFSDINNPTVVTLGEKTGNIYDEIRFINV